MPNILFTLRNITEYMFCICIQILSLLQWEDETHLVLTNFLSFPRIHFTSSWKNDMQLFFKNYYLFQDTKLTMTPSDKITILLRKKNMCLDSLAYKWSQIKVKRRGRGLGDVEQNSQTSMLQYREKDKKRKERKHIEFPH